MRPQLRDIGCGKTGTMLNFDWIAPPSVDGSILITLALFELQYFTKLRYHS